MKRGIGFFILVLLCGLSTQTQADTFAYAVRSNVDNSLYQINLNTGAADLIGPVGYSDVEGLSTQPGTGVLFGVDDVTESLLTINTTTGAGSFVGAMFPGQANKVIDMGLAFAPIGTLWMATDDPKTFYSINPATGLAAAVGSQGQSVNGLACSAAGVMYGLGGDGINNLVTINLATGAATVVGPLVNVSVNNGGLDFAPDGTLWGIEENGDIFTLNTTTGAATVVSNTLPGFESLVVIPEPATMALTLLSGLALIRRKR